jgi:hypothetical protein
LRSAPGVIDATGDCRFRSVLLREPSHDAACRALWRALLNALPG